MVTGGAKRIGRAIALRVAKEGARVAIHYHESEAEARATALECGAERGDAAIFRANLENVGEITALFEEIEKHFGRMEALINNAARFTTIDPLKVTESDWDFVHSVNLKAAFFCAQQAARQMLAAMAGES